MIEFTEPLTKRLDIYTFMCRRGKELRSDKDFNKQIKIIHRDNSNFFLPHACLEEDETRYFIWTEHCGYFYFHKEDLEEMEIITWEFRDGDYWIEDHKIIIFDMGKNDG